MVHLTIDGLQKVSIKFLSCNSMHTILLVDICITYKKYLLVALNVMSYFFFRDLNLVIDQKVAEY